MYATEKLVTCNNSNCILNTTSFHLYDKHSRAVFEILDVWRYGWNPFMQSCGHHKEKQEICNKEEQLYLCHKVEYQCNRKNIPHQLKSFKILLEGTRYEKKLSSIKGAPIYVHVPVRLSAQSCLAMLHLQVTESS